MISRLSKASLRSRLPWASKTEHPNIEKMSLRVHTSTNPVKSGERYRDPVYGVHFADGKAALEADGVARCSRHAGAGRSSD